MISSSLYLLASLAIVSHALAFRTGVSRPLFPRLPVLSFSAEGNAEEITEAFDESDLQSPEITRLRRAIDDTYAQVAKVQEQLEEEKALLKQLDDQYGPEIARIKTEFAVIKERTYAEADLAAAKARGDALKEVLPITDNFLRIKQLYKTLQSDNEQQIFQAYESISDEFSKLIGEFGVTRVESLGQPFDYNFMEAISTAPSTEYPPNYVCIEYQIGYKIGERCIRPSLVVVSAGPGPQ